MKLYESVIIVNSSLSEETLNKIVKRTEDFITKNGGKVNETIPWGKRRLAYLIKKFQYGYYFIFLFEAPPGIINELEREYRLDENILRFMTFFKSPQEIQAEKRTKEVEALLAAKIKAAEEKEAEEREAEAKRVKNKVEPVVDEVEVVSDATPDEEPVTVEDDSTTVEEEPAEVEKEIEESTADAPEKSTDSNEIESEQQ